MKEKTMVQISTVSLQNMQMLATTVVHREEPFRDIDGKVMDLPMGLAGSLLCSAAAGAILGTNTSKATDQEFEDELEMIVEMLRLNAAQYRREVQKVLAGDDSVGQLAVFRSDQ